MYHQPPLSPTGGIHSSLGDPSVDYTRYPAPTAGYRLDIPPVPPLPTSLSPLANIDLSALTIDEPTTGTFHLTLTRGGPNGPLVRTYDDFVALHSALLLAFPDASGRTGRQPRTLPFLPDWPSHRDAVAERRLRRGLEFYVEDLLRLPPSITAHPAVVRFFAPPAGDVEPNDSASNVSTLSQGRRSAPASSAVGGPALSVVDGTPRNASLVPGSPSVPHHARSHSVGSAPPAPPSQRTYHDAPPMPYPRSAPGSQVGSARSRSPAPPSPRPPRRADASLAYDDEDEEEVQERAQPEKRRDVDDLDERYRVRARRDEYGAGADRARRSPSVRRDEYNNGARSASARRDRDRDHDDYDCDARPSRSSSSAARRDDEYDYDVPRRSPSTRRGDNDYDSRPARSPATRRGETEYDSRPSRSPSTRRGEEYDSRPARSPSTRRGDADRSPSVRRRRSPSRSRDPSSGNGVPPPPRRGSTAPNVNGGNRRPSAASAPRSPVRRDSREPVADAYANPRRRTRSPNPPPLRGNDYGPPSPRVASLASAPASPTYPRATTMSTSTSSAPSSPSLRPTADRDPDATIKVTFVLPRVQHVSAVRIAASQVSIPTLLSAAENKVDQAYAGGDQQQRKPTSFALVWRDPHGRNVKINSGTLASILRAVGDAGKLVVFLVY
ncbi:hypothetical protein H9P43_002098 [Blastocladiella emersonii ATCC 22665]|nr:hypothetical protein H9P43_002098 [Blastocladiella emersonii ATCC 22665]